MDIPELREEMLIPHISELIENVLNKKTISLWQKLDIKRDYVPAKLVKFDCIQKKLKFYPLDLKHHFDFKSHLPIYFYEKMNTMVFKSSISYQSSFELELRMPETLLIQDFRGINRKVFEQGESIIFDLKADRGNIQFNKEVLDLSADGISFKISARECPLFYEGDVVSFKLESCNIELPAKQGKIIYTTTTINSHFPNKKYTRVGVKFI